MEIAHITQKSNWTRCIALTAESLGSRMIFIFEYESEMKDMEWQYCFR